MTDRFIDDRDAASQDAPPQLPGARIHPRGVKLFNASHVAFATFLGSPLAGGVVLALSHRRAKTGRAWQPLVVGAALTAVMIGVGFALKGKAVGMIPIVGLMAMRQMALAQMPDIERAAGGAMATQPASWWSAIGVSLGFLAACVALIFALGLGWAFATAPPGVAFGHDQEVQYAEGATEADARLVGSYLMEMGFFSSASDGGKTVRVARDHGAAVVSFVLQDGAWEQSEVRTAFSLVRGQLAERFNGPVVVHLCDDTMETESTIAE